jgi:hypothetical protein
MALGCQTAASIKEMKPICNLHVLCADLKFTRGRSRLPANEKYESA